MCYISSLNFPALNRQNNFLMKFSNSTKDYIAAVCQFSPECPYLRSKIGFSACPSCAQRAKRSLLSCRKWIVQNPSYYSQFGQGQFRDRELPSRCECICPALVLPEGLGNRRADANAFLRCLGDSRLSKGDLGGSHA